MNDVYVYCNGKLTKEKASKVKKVHQATIYLG